jgi:DNA-directed RNA polymerase specialized sigma24 family protein
VKRTWRSVCPAHHHDGVRARQLLDRPASGPDFTLLIEARDFWRVHRWRLSDKQRATFEAWLCGATYREMAVGEGVTEEAIHQRIGGAILKLRRQAARDEERK